MPLSFLVLACFDKYKSKIKYIITLLIVIQKNNNPKLYLNMSL